MKLIVAMSGHIIDFSESIEYGFYEGEPVEKYKLSDSEGNIRHYLVASDVEVVDILDEEMPDDFFNCAGNKYMYNSEIEKIVINPEYKELVDPLNEVSGLAAVTFVLLAQKTNYVPDDVIKEYSDVFEEWSGEDSYSVGDIRRYEGELYRCITAVGANPTWTPSAAPSVWVRFDDPAIEWPDWRQPTDATNVYASGSKVTYEGQHWTSNVDNNSWAPGVYGWTLVP